MDYLNNVFGLMLGFGILALIVVLLLYLFKKKKTNRSVGSTVVESNVEVIRKADELVDYNTDSLRAYLSPLRNDEPVFISVVSNLLERTKKTSEIKMIRIVAKQLEAKNELLTVIDKHEEQIHTLTRKKEDFKQRDEMKDLTHERDKKEILNEIELLKNPPPPPPSPPPPKSQAKRKAEDKRRKESEEDKRDAIVERWRKELLDNPNFDNEDIETEVERRKRARGWLDNI